MDLHVYRFDGLHLESVPGTFVHGNGIVRRPTPHLVSTDPPHDEPDLIEQLALIAFSLVLNGGDAISIEPNGAASSAIRASCARSQNPNVGALATSEAFTHVVILAHGSDVVVRLERGGSRIVSRIRFNDSAVRHEFLERPRGC